jgi:hypothetical protein
MSCAWAAGALGAGLAALWAGAVSAETLQLRLVEKATSDVVTDLGEKGDSVGDILTFNNEVFENGKPVGHSNGWCVRTVPGKAWECTWTTALADGQIAVQGTFWDGKDSVLIVTGGTCNYSQADGEMLLHPRNPEGTEYDFVFKLMRAAYVKSDCATPPS